MRIVPTLVLVASLLPALFASSPAAETIRGDGDGLALGANWGPYETYHGVSFRWVDNDAEIVVRARSGAARIAIACEGGPSLGQRSFPLRVLDASRRQVDHVACDGAERRAEMLLPPSATDARYFLHADGGGRRVPGEPRILNFRVFSVDDGAGARTARDVVDPRSGVRLGDGWYPVEQYKGQTFRWMERAGRIFVVADGTRRADLRLLLEVGPSVGARSAAVTVRNGHGRVLVRTTLNGRGVVTVPMATQPGENEIVLDVASAHKRVPHDPRVLDLRLIDAVLGRRQSS